MNNFKYKVSIIVPVYNVEQYVAGCLDSLINQTMDKSEMEIIVVNDGSPDNSLAICQKYAALYPCIKVYSKENEGLSATRNFGIKRANGKYLMFIDSDDTFTRETVKEVTDFFDTVYDEVDEVTYLDQGYKFGKKMPLHFRYNYLKESGVYDLHKYPFLMQTRVNVCVKNFRENNFLFDVTPGFKQEDQEYNCRVLQDKMKIGYCKKGEYQYNRSNETSIMATAYNPIAMFETCMKYFEEMFARFEGEVPVYYQSMYLHDVNWKTRANILYPYHYNEEEFAVAMGRIKKLLDRVDDTTIATFPDMDNFHKAYWMSMKNDPKAMTYVTEDDQVYILSDDHVIYDRKKIELILYRVFINDNKVKMLVSAKSPIFTFTEKPKVFAVINKDGESKDVEVDAFPSSFNYYRSKTETNKFWTFYFDYNLEEIDNVEFSIEVDGVRIGTNYYFMPGSPFDNSLNLKKYVKDNWMIQFNDNVFAVKNVTDEEALSIRDEQTESYKAKHAEQYDARKRMAMIQKERPIWLYYDCKGVDYDNAYYQFVHDLEKEDGVDRYYVSNNPKEQWSTIFDEKQMEQVIQFGSELHKALYVSADKLITAFIEDVNVCPFDPNEVKFYKDMCKFEIVYLQHGILHATLPWKYSPERIHVDRVVVSSNFEIENFQKNYGFRKKDLICAGMPRFDFLDNAAQKTNRILFAPTWRLYLIGQNADGTWVPNNNKFMGSDYFKKIQDFLLNEKLAELLEKNDLYLDFKLHPIFKCYEECFEKASDRIVFAENSVNDNEYSAFITDFSSYVFNFAYLKCPIIYFVPDMMEFKAGMNQYRALDLPFEEAFGDLAENEDELLEALNVIADNGMALSEKYADRIRNFYLPLVDCRDGVYEELRK